MITALAATLTTAALLPLGTHQLSSAASFMPAMLSVVACFDVLSVYLLLGGYRDRGDLRLLVMSWAYTWSLVSMAGYALAFPGVVSDNPPLAVTASMAPYFYLLWHVGFPVLLGAAWAPWPVSWSTSTPPPRRRRLSAASTAAVAVGSGAVVASLAVLAHRLPVLIVGLDYSAMTSLTAPVTTPLVLLALVAAVRGTRLRGGPERWSTIAILACLCDLALTYTSGSRYSLGWYCGRSLTLVASGVVLMSMLAEFRRLKARAEYDAATDQLTGLHNRRSVYEELEQIVARSSRSGSPLGVLSLDLDMFKQVNDIFGHAVGDMVLSEVGLLLTQSCRRGDVVARVGGEEFLILLPDTDAAGTLTAAEKIRGAVELMTIPACKVRMTASLGVANLRADDIGTTTLLRRVDTALYQAKQDGRNRVVVSAKDAYRSDDDLVEEPLNALVAAR